MFPRLFRRSSTPPPTPSTPAVRGDGDDADERAQLAVALADARAEAGYGDRDVIAVFAAYVGLPDTEARAMIARIEDRRSIGDVPVWALQAYAWLFGRRVRLVVEDRRIPSEQEADPHGR
ncbi:hypothetical protein [Micromonospora sp. NPDC047730]|uniref:hypothetical protein n=1 Tax=Micromonospora sp. NPDC047730 TaxID=3364253 RepID=UPI003712BE48